MLSRLPWYAELTKAHRAEMLAEIGSCMGRETSREQFAALLLQWADTAHCDGKRRRLEHLRAAGLLRPAGR